MKRVLAPLLPPLVLAQVLVLTALPLQIASAATPPAPPTGPGSLYDRYCLACHGERGDGRGPAAPWLWPKPRDFTKAQYRFRSTPAGRAPTDADLARIVLEGLPGTSMPAFAGILDAEAVAELVAVVKAFAPKRFEKAAPPPVVVPPVPKDLGTLEPRGAELFQRAGCVSCHGAGLAGDGPAAASLKDEHGRLAPPPDLTRVPLKRGARGPSDIYLSIATGLDGAGMPGFAGALPEADLWALVAFVEARRYRGAWAPATGPIDPRAVESWRPGFQPIVQGPVPDGLPPAVSSLSAKQCGRCHPRQYESWSQSLHARTASPGTLGQFVGAKGGFIAGCSRCHMPLAEQLEPSAAKATGLDGSVAYDEQLRDEGVTCAVCHLRDWVRRGPPLAKESKLLEIEGYPFVVEARYERADMCLPCHQLSPGDLVEGRPLLDTYREWLEGPYMRAGVQCQHCHMPEREHSWKGAHDPTTVRQGIRWQLTALRSNGKVLATARLSNVGAGHYFPTTPTPAGYLDLELLDASGKVLASHTRRIGRHLQYKSGWKQLEDTRIPPGVTSKFDGAWEGQHAKKATRVRMTLRWIPDDYYIGFYKRLLGRKLLAPARPLIERALQRAEKASFIVFVATQDIGE